MTDPIADMLTRIRNALLAEHKVVIIPYSNFKIEIVRVLKDEGYVEGYEFLEKGKHKEIKIDLRYTTDGNSVIKAIKRVSKRRNSKGKCRYGCINIVNFKRYHDRYPC